MNKLKINWKAIPEALSTIEKYGKQHLPTILVVTGLGLSVYSKFLTAHEAVKAEKAIDHKARKRLDEKQEPLDRWDRAKIYFEYCWLSMLVESGGIAMILAAHKINLGKIAAMTSLYQFSKTELVGLKDKIIENDGENTLKKYEKEIRTKDYSPDDISAGYVHETGKGKTLFKDKVTGLQFRSSMGHVLAAITELNTMLQEEGGYGGGCVELSEFLEMLDESRSVPEIGHMLVFRYNAPRDLVHQDRILDYKDYIDPATGEPPICYINYKSFLTPSDDLMECRPY